MFTPTVNNSLHKWRAFNVADRCSRVALRENRKQHFEQLIIQHENQWSLSSNGTAYESILFDVRFSREIMNDVINLSRSLKIAVVHLSTLFTPVPYTMKHDKKSFLTHSYSQQLKSSHDREQSSKLFIATILEIKM